MEQPYFLLSLLFVLALGIALGVVWCKSYGYIQYGEERKPPAVYTPCIYCDCGKDVPYCDGDCEFDIKHEAQMMREAQLKQKQGGDSK